MITSVWELLDSLIWLIFFIKYHFFSHLGERDWQHGLSIVNVYSFPGGPPYPTLVLSRPVCHCVCGWCNLWWPSDELVDHITTREQTRLCHKHVKVSVIRDYLIICVSTTRLTTITAWYLLQLRHWCELFSHQILSTGRGCPRPRWRSPRRPETWFCPDSLTWTLSRTCVKTSMRCSRYGPRLQWSGPQWTLILTTTIMSSLCVGNRKFLPEPIYKWLKHLN